MNGTSVGSGMVYVLAARRVLLEVFLWNLAFAKHKNELNIYFIIHFDNS